MSNRPILELAQITKAYGGASVLAETDLRVMDGEFLTILGPSGSGKTTILRIIGGFAAPSRGQVRLDGEDITRWPSYRRPFNTVFQDYALFPHMTVAGNVAYGLAARRTSEPEIRRRVAAVLEVAGLADMAGRRPTELSGGQRQRVALARAIVCEPRIVLLDEPLAALDAELRRTMRGFLKDLQRRMRTTFLFVTHDQEEAMSISDRIVVMERGRVAQIGAPQEIYDHPANAFVARFFGENNLLPARRIADGKAAISPLGRHSLADAAPGSDDLLVAVRPERLRVTDLAAQVPDGDARVEGEVASLVFLGAATEVIVRLAGGESLRVRIASARPDDGVRPGARVMVTWSPGAVSVLRR
jgi:spermidine/putrescine transport system ATP-binding protein